VIYQEEASEAVQTFCRDNDIQILAYRPFELGKALSNPKLDAIAQAHQATPSQIALAWLLSKQTFPIPKARRKEFIDQNIAALDIQLSKKEIIQLNNL
jgi:2,5-diketo-D-gluconate reductase B